MVSNAFIVPQWGGVVISSSRTIPGENCSVVDSEFELPMKLFILHLRQLLGIPFPVFSLVYLRYN